MGKREVLESVLAQIKKKHGEGAIMWLGEQPHLEVETIPTGSLSLDIALGIGGVPRGRIVEIFGPEASGKTTLALHIIAEAQKLGGTVAFIDAEHALDPHYARAIGVDLDKILLSQPNSGEQPWRSQNTSCAAARSMLSSLTLWPRSSPKPNSKAPWAMPKWACKRAS
jgi:recombination protein RecA